MIVTLAVRVLQIIFAAVVLALSVVLIKDYGPGHGYSLIDYGAFCGGAGIVFAAFGIIACFIDPLQGIVMLVVDGFATLFTLAGGIAFAARIKVGNCSDVSDYGYISQHADPFAPSPNKNYPGVGSDAKKYLKAIENDAIGRCREVQATTAFLWFLFACFAVTVALSFMGKKQTGRGSVV